MATEQWSRKYLDFFASRDLLSLSNMLSEEVTLKDWNTSLTGKKKVLDFNKQLFESFSIVLRITNILAQENDSAIEFELTLTPLNDEEDEIFLLVTDILSFDNKGKINAIRAYRGN